MAIKPKQTAIRDYEYKFSNPPMNKAQAEAEAKLRTINGGYWKLFEREVGQAKEWLLQTWVSSYKEIYDKDGATEEELKAAGLVLAKAVNQSANVAQTAFKISREADGDWVAEAWFVKFPPAPANPGTP